MSDLIKLVRTYRVTAGLAERLRLAEVIIRQIAPDLRLYVFSRISHEAAEDASQEVLKAVATGMRKFAGGTQSRRPNAADGPGRTLADDGRVGTGRADNGADQA
jgi:hypothetical protein